MYVFSDTNWQQWVKINTRIRACACGSTYEVPLSACKILSSYTVEFWRSKRATFLIKVDETNVYLTNTNDNTKNIISYHLGKMPFHHDHLNSKWIELKPNVDFCFFIRRNNHLYKCSTTLYLHSYDSALYSINYPPSIPLWPIQEF